ncbi:spindle assembly abnormal protein 6 homolog [Mizuhopecten yessoensis]|uniref:Spindle assembly abnormal protein 6 homolog n=1 Tax=Mizuhopecten yessoensis TaxID=6573 RepID=A0A210R5L7_MIZYE|nr:spindle assembly abnormal protein 6 homolog [Mizuhopecten yessoensis]OWF56330.1 Spindle assembly abnormal protein 6-like [Mizuhopecten yessoensis]
MADELFTKKLPVVFKCPDREDRRMYVQLKMELQTISSPLHKKELVVKMTDEKDLFFLYTLRIGEEDFQSLKTQQGLLVDFGAFPQKFIDLLDMCLREEHKEMPKFVLHFVSQSSVSGDRTMSVLNVIETNPFKHLTHLSLKFFPGTDSDVKKYLADCLKQLRDTNALLQQRLEHTDADLNHKLHQTQETLSSKSIELDHLKAEWTARMTDLSARHKHEMATEKEKTLQMQSNFQQKQDRDRKDMEQAHMKIVKQMESKLYEFEGSNKDLLDRKYKSESSIREMKSKLSALEEEHLRAKQELQSLRKQNTTLDGDYHEQEKLVNQLSTRVAVLEQEVKDKEQVITRSTDLLGSEQDQKRKFEDEVDYKSKDIHKLEHKVRAMAEELMKGNEIIKKLQGEIKNYHAKIKLRNQIATEQEKLLGEKDQELERLRQDLASTKANLKQTTEENVKLNENLKGTMEKLEESRQLLKTNENVIQWLNKQINETQVNHQRVGMFEMPGATTNFRPSSAMHNYSTSSYGSQGSHPESHSMGVAMPRSYPNPHRHQQIQYNPGNPRKSGLPQPLPGKGKMAPVPIPEEIRPHHSPGSGGSGGDKENDPPLDPKFLQKRDDAIPLRGLVHHSGSPPPIQSSVVPPANSIRLSQHGIVPRTSQPPLASAYFPGQKMS